MADNDNLITTIGIGVEVKSAKAVKGLTEIADALKKLGDAKGATISKTIPSRLNEISDALLKFKNVRGFKPLQTLNDFASSIQKIAGASKISISKVLPDRITAISESIKSLKGVDLTPLERLADILVKISDAQGAKVPSLTSVARTVKATKAIAKAKEKEDVSHESKTTGSVVGKEIKMVSLDDIKDKVKGITREGAIQSAIGAFSRLKQAIGESVESAVGSLSRLRQVIGDGLGVAVNKANGALLKLKTDIGHGFVSALKKATSAYSKFVMQFATAPIRKFASAVSGAVKRLGGFLSAIKRIAIYRAIRSALKEITQGFKEGMDNLYQYSLLINGTFKDSMDSLATSALYLKNSLGAMVAPIVNALAPAVDYLVDKFVDLLNTFNELIATLTGASTWTRALKYPKAYAEEADKASGSAKKLRATLLGFDEINRLDDNTKGGRGSGAEELDYSKMFEEVDVSDSAKSWVQRLKDAISGEGDSIGTIMGETINNAVNKYNEWINKPDWKGIGEAVGTNLSDAIKTTNSKNIGNAIASTINAGFKTLNGFTSKVDWDAFGKFISDGINGFFEGVGTEDIAHSISNGIIGALKMSASFISNLDVVKIGEKVGDLIKGIKWGDMLSGLGDLISEAILKLPDLLKAGSSIVEKMVEGMLPAIRKLPAEGEKIIRSIITGITMSLVTLFQEGLKIGDKIYEAIKSWFEKLKEKGGKQMVLEIIEGIKDKLQDIWDWGVSVAKKFLDGIKYGLTHSQLVKDVKEKIVEIFKSRGGLVTDDVYTVLGADNPSHNALGGSVQTGDLFYANEHEPELIAHVGNRTQIANNDQITDSIRVATQQGNAESNGLLRQAVALLNGILLKDNTVVAEITTDSITNGLRRQNLRNGSTTIPVGG